MENILASFLEFAQLDRRSTAAGLSVTEMERWVELKSELDGRFSVTNERRASIRVPSRLRCSFDSLGSFHDQLITNLSRGGVFVKTERPLPVGTKLQLKIQLEDSGAQLEVDSEVVSNHVGAGFDTSIAGMGVQFSRRGARIMREIDDLFEREIRRAFGPDDPESAS